jgi:hypothetical protein
MVADEFRDILAALRLRHEWLARRLGVQTDTSHD